MLGTELRAPSTLTQYPHFTHLVRIDNRATWVCSEESYEDHPRSLTTPTLPTSFVSTIGREYAWRRVMSTIHAHSIAHFTHLIRINDRVWVCLDESFVHHSHSLNTPTSPAWFISTIVSHSITNKKSHSITNKKSHSIINKKSHSITN